jgi:hypothetical protein
MKETENLTSCLHLSFGPEGVSERVARSQETAHSS